MAGAGAIRLPREAATGCEGEISGNQETLKGSMSNQKGKES